MATDAGRQWRDAVDDAINAGAAGRYQPLRREPSRGGNDGPRPLEFDQAGFPIPQPIARFRQRIGRLIYG
jgi:hypothetical protein